MKRFLLVCVAIVVLSETARAQLVHRYSFTFDGRDSVGSLDATLVNGAAISDGAVQFDGVDDYVSLPSGSLSSATGNSGASHVGTGTGKLTIEAWFTASAATGIWSRVFDFGIPFGASDFNSVFFCPVTDIDSSRLSVSNDNWTTFCNLDVSASNTGCSVYVSGVFDDVNDEMSLYLNGTLAANGVMINSLGDITDVYNYLGRSNYPSDPASMTGSITELRIYDSALTSGQVAANYAVGPNVVPEPGSITLLLVAAASLFAYAWRRRRPAV